MDKFGWTRPFKVAVNKEYFQGSHRVGTQNEIYQFRNISFIICHLSKDVFWNVQYAIYI